MKDIGQETINALKRATERYIPQGYVQYTPDIGDYPKDLFAVYVKTEPYISAIFYTRKQSNHTWFYRFETMEDAKRTINETISKLMAWESRKAERKAERKAPHTLKVGDILYSSWGYDQTNIDFYQVTKLVGSKMVEIRQIASRRGEFSLPSWEVFGVKDSFLEKSHLNNYENNNPVRKMVNPTNNSVYVREFARAYPWDGHAMHETDSMYGH